jgi:hypothetical protein
LLTRHIVSFSDGLLLWSVEDVFILEPLNAACVVRRNLVQLTDNDTSTIEILPDGTETPVYRDLRHSLGRNPYVMYSGGGGGFSKGFRAGGLGFGKGGRVGKKCLLYYDQDQFTKTIALTS